MYREGVTDPFMCSVGSLDDVDVFINYLPPFRGILIAGDFPRFSVCALGRWWVGFVCG